MKQRDKPDQPERVEVARGQTCLRDPETYVPARHMSRAEKQTFIAAETRKGAPYWR